MNRLAILAVPLALAACAQRPDAIAPVVLPASAYASEPCETIASDLGAERATLAALERQQNKAATGDAWGVFLLGAPVSSAFGGDKAGEVGLAKGRVLAIEARLAECRAL